MTNPHVARQEVTYEAPGTRKILDREFIHTFSAADATPSVDNKRVCAAGNVGANNVTYFDDGFDGQSISILGDGFTTVVHNLGPPAKIATHNAANLLLLANKVYRFTRYSKVWIEDA